MLNVLIEKVGDPNVTPSRSPKISYTQNNTSTFSFYLSGGEKKRGRR